MVNLMTKEVDGVLEMFVPCSNAQVFGNFDRGLVVDENNSRFLDFDVEVRQHVLHE